MVFQCVIGSVPVQRSMKKNGLKRRRCTEPASDSWLLAVTASAFHACLFGSSPGKFRLFWIDCRVEATGIL
jgi:hypothetical protein